MDPGATGPDTHAHEVIVLGAGPAGSAAAILLARRSHRVALVRPSRTPAGPLAESVPPSARRVLDEIGALPVLEGAGLHPNRGNSVWWADHEPRHEVFADDAAGFHTDRQTLESILVSVAESAGVRVYTGHSARKAHESADGWRITCEGPDGAVTLTAPWVVDATGRHGFLARNEGRESDRDTTTLALVRRFRRPGGWPADEADLTLVESYDAGWAWSVPVDAETRCFTAMIDQRRVDLAGDDLDAHLAHELSGTRHIGSQLEGAEPVGQAWACPASLYSAKRYGRRGLLLAGDAGSFIDPLSSFGVKKALSSGWLAGIVAHSSLVDPAIEAVAIDFFDQREREVYRRYREASAEFFESAASAHGSGYWSERARAARAAADRSRDEHAAAGRREAGTIDHIDLFGAEVPEAEVRAAFDRIRELDGLSAVPGTTLRTFERPGIDGYRIVLQDHLATDAWPDGIRYVRGVDLRTLLGVAPRFREVPDGWSEYNGLAAPVSLPDYLTALSTAFAIGILEHGNGP